MLKATALFAVCIPFALSAAKIPATALKSEVEFENAAPAWIAIAETVVVPNAAKDGLLRIDKKPVDPVTGIKEPCGGAVSAFGSIWTGSCGDGAIVRIDGKTAKVAATLPVGMAPGRRAIAATTDSIWALTDTRGTLSRIDPEQNAVVAEFRVPADCGSLLFGETALWLACPAENKVLRIEPQTNLVDKSIDVAAQPEALASGEGSVWVLCAKDGKVDRIDPKTNKVSKTIELGAPAANGSMAFGEASLWVSAASTLTRIDPGAEKIAQQFVGVGGGAIQAGLGSIWLAQAGKVVRFDPKRIAATLPE